jgi:tRNA C32,U32 (ribose-2'-O)-methylase TrmJ
MAATQTEEVKLMASVCLERLKGMLIDALTKSDFLDRRRMKDSDETIRRFFRRLRRPARDAELWQGVLRQMLWKKRSESGPLI